MRLPRSLNAQSCLPAVSDRRYSYVLVDPFSKKIINFFHFVFADSYQAKDVSYSWVPENPVQVNPQLTGGEGKSIEKKLALTSVTEDTCHVTTSTGEYSCIKLVLKFKNVKN